ncbi:MAG TPA: MBOAT family O-acyltransferase [Vicinamibacterales bacterium]|nr:MBOAT family O-acyltransferase [Vicinamibacterales bacterium]
MIFHSVDFVVFFCVVVALYWRLPQRGQNVLLLVASYFFYGYVHPWFLILIATSTTIDYLAARGMERRPEHRRRFLWMSILSNFGMLGFFKYFNFFIDNVHAAAGAMGIETSLPVLRVVLPVGISFYTFQAMSYTVDVFRGELRARRNLLDVAVFISFFPHLVAGPIQRASFLLPQVESRRRFSMDQALSGFYLMCWGFFKKLVIADNVGVIANRVFALADPSFEILWAGVFAFAIQIYADFSAYTDIARGSSRWLGFELTENFEHPYLARSPTDFWRRWNISLSTWFRDYVYIPLGGSRAGGWIWARNIMVTFVLSGLWHGASWNYVLWGFYHGLLLLATRAHSILRPGAPPRRAWLRVPQVAGMFLLTLFGWLLFRETDFGAIVRDVQLSPFASTPLERQAGLYLFLVAFVYSIPLWGQSLWVELGLARRLDTSSPGWPRMALRAAACGAAFAAILVLRSETSLDFIYFQF